MTSTAWPNAASRSLKDRALGRRIGFAAAELVREHYCTGAIVPQYEQLYRDVLAIKLELKTQN